MMAKMESGTEHGAAAIDQSGIYKFIHKPLQFLFVGFEVFPQRFQFLVEFHELLLEAVFSDEFNRITELRVVRRFEVENFRRFVANNSDAMLADITHCRSHAFAVNFDAISEAIISITNSDCVASRSTTFSFKFNIHTYSSFFVGICIVDQTFFQDYTLRAVVNPIAGIGVLEFIRAHDRAFAVFLCAKHAHIRIMVGRVGASQDAPGSLMTGYANPARLTTLEIGVSGGEFKYLSSEDAIMATIPAIAHPEIAVINGQAVTSSLSIADYFTKRHDDVLKKIRALECSPEFNARNFAAVEYTDAKGERRPAYQITRDGFAFLAMGFAGKRAAQFKESYITAFNQMEKALAGPVDTSTTAHNAHVAYLYMAEIHRVWMAQLYPMLMSSQSPIAVSLYDYINDGFFVAGLVDRALNGKRQEVQG